MWPTEVVMKSKTVPAARFKSQCLGLLDEVEKTRGEIVITKRGRPVARLVPLTQDVQRRKLTGRILGDIVGSIEPEWIK
jgi:prevent-host-death family protein